MNAAAINEYGRKYEWISRTRYIKTERNIGRKTELEFSNRKLKNNEMSQRRKANAKSAAVRAYMPVKMVAVLAVMFACLWSPLQLGNEYLRSSNFEKVTVAHGESLKDIAVRYTADQEKQQSLIDAIEEVNALPKGEPLPVGWKLLIPVIK